MGNNTDGTHESKFAARLVQLTSSPLANERRECYWDRPTMLECFNTNMTTFFVDVDTQAPDPTLTVRVAELIGTELKDVFTYEIRRSELQLPAGP